MMKRHSQTHGSGHRTSSRRNTTADKAVELLVPPTGFDPDQWVEATAASFLKRPRLKLDQADEIPDAPGVFGIFYEPSSSPVEEDLSRPRFLELMAREDLPVFIGSADSPSTLRERIFDVAEFLDQAAGLSWTWFRAAVICTEASGARSLQVRLEHHLTSTPWHWMGFDRLFSHQYTELSTCTLVADGDGYPTPPGGLIGN